MILIHRRQLKCLLLACLSLGFAAGTLIWTLNA